MVDPQTTRKKNAREKKMNKRKPNAANDKNLKWLNLMNIMYEICLCNNLTHRSKTRKISNG
jgi:hypothetical protein